LYSPIQDLFDYLFVQSILMKQNRNLVKLNWDANLEILVLTT
jgi:hypothetical protein